jgi:hypothetical protein
VRICVTWFMTPCIHPFLPILVCMKLSSGYMHSIDSLSTSSLGYRTMVSLQEGVVTLMSYTWDSLLHTSCFRQAHCKGSVFLFPTALTQGINAHFRYVNPRILGLKRQDQFSSLGIGQEFHFGKDSLKILRVIVSAHSLAHRTGILPWGK